MEKLIIQNRHDLCCVYGGKGSVSEETLARILGRLVGTAAKIIYDILTGGGSESEPSTPKAEPKPAS